VAGLLINVYFKRLVFKKLVYFSMQFQIPMHCKEEVFLARMFPEHIHFAEV